MSIDDHTRAMIESALAADPVVLFMKGSRSQPQCGFSAKTVGILDTLLPTTPRSTYWRTRRCGTGSKSTGNGRQFRSCM